MSSHKNRVKMTSATTGTGTLTLGSASSGYQSFASAYGANATVDILITEGTTWEVARDCAYTNSGTTVTRGTLEASSTGSAINFGGTQVVSVIATADRGRSWDSAALNTKATGTDADTPMVVGTMYVVDMSAWATADRTYTLPATAAVGDRIGVMVTSGDASHELILTAGAGDTLNGIAGGTEWSRLFITNEVVIMRCVAANATWVVELDGRIPSKCLMQAASAQTAVASGSWVTATKGASGSWSVVYDVGNLANTGSHQVVARRAGKYALFGYVGLGLVTDGAVFIVAFQKNATGNPLRGGRLQNGASNNVAAIATTVYALLAAGDSEQLQFFQNSTGTVDTEYISGESVTSLGMTEIL